MNLTESPADCVHPLVICLVEDGDQPAVLAVYRQCQDFLALGPEPVATAELVQQDIEHSRRAAGLFCAIFDPAGQIIGVLDYLPSHFEGNPEQAFISLLMIAAPHRRRGLGQQVIGHIESQIQKNAQVRAILTAVQVNNPQALRFWRKHGYRIISGPEVQPDTTITYRLHKSL